MKSTMRAPFVVAVACVVAGCATPEPSHGELQKGAYRPPVRAPTFSPSEDAPHTFRPGEPSPVQPGPRPTRVLPETPETRRGPGIWAAKPPTAEPEYKFLDIPIPPPDGAETSGDRLATYICAGHLSASLDRTKIKAWALKLPKDLRRCIAASMYYQCAATQEAGQPNAPGWPKWGPAREVAKRMMDAVCTPEMLDSDDLKTVEREVKKAWNRIGGAK